MSEQKVPRSMEQRIVIKFLVGENVPAAEIHHRLQQQYGEECGLFTHKSVLVIFEPPCITASTAFLFFVLTRRLPASVTARTLIADKDFTFSFKHVY